MFEILRNLFYKDTHVIVKAGSYMAVPHKISLSAVITGNELDTAIITQQTSHWPEKTGTYGIIDLDSIVDPEAMIFWGAFEQSVGTVDVAGLIHCELPNIRGDVYFAVNNPMIGKPWCTIFGPGPIVYKRAFSEGDSFIYKDFENHTIKVQRLSDTSTKEFVITVDPTPNWNP